MIGIGVAVAMGVLFALSAVRLVLGPTLYDRTHAAIMGLTWLAIACAGFAVTQHRLDGVDAGFAIMLGAFVLAAAALKFFRAHTFQAAMAPQEQAR